MCLSVKMAAVKKLSVEKAATEKATEKKVAHEKLASQFPELFSGVLNNFQCIMKVIHRNQK